jgi:hypothetical protein
VVYADDKEPIFDVKFVVFDQELGDSTTMCSTVVFNAEFAIYDEQLVFDAEYAAHDELVFDEEDKGLAFDIEPISDGVCVNDHTIARIGYDEDPTLDEGPIFDESDHGEEEPSTDTELILSSIITVAATMTMDVRFSDTTVDASFTCSTQCPHVVVNNEFALVTGSRAGVLRPLYRALDAYCLSNGGRGWRMDLFYEDLRLLIPAHGDTTAPRMAMRSFPSNLVVTDGFDVIQCWDPGLPDGSAFIQIARPCGGFHWDPGAVEGLQSIELATFDPAYHHDLDIDEFQSKLGDPGLADRSRFVQLTGSGSDCHPTQLYWSPIVFWLQQRCGRTDTIALADIDQSVLQSVC